MPQHIGIVACSAEGASLCYRTLCVEGAQLFGPHAHPEVTMHTYSLAEYMNCIYRGDWQGVGELMLSSAEKLAKTGADFLICPDNTIHRALPRIEARSPLPWLHIAEVVAAQAVEQRLPTPGAYRHTLARRQRGLSRQAHRMRPGGHAPNGGRARRDRSHHHGRAGLRPVQAGGDCLLSAGLRADEGCRLRRRHTRLHRDPFDHERLEFTAADTRLHAPARAGGAATGRTQRACVGVNESPVNQASLCHSFFLRSDSC